MQTGHSSFCRRVQFFSGSSVRFAAASLALFTLDDVVPNDNKRLIVSIACTMFGSCLRMSVSNLKFSGSSLFRNLYLKFSVKSDPTGLDIGYVESCWVIEKWQGIKKVAQVSDTCTSQGTVLLIIPSKTAFKTVYYNIMNLTDNNTLCTGVEQQHGYPLSLHK